MANVISVTSTITQAKTFLIDAPKDKLLQTVFFPTSDEDMFVSSDVMFDLDEGDFGIAPWVAKGYKTKNVMTYKSPVVQPPRCALEVPINPTAKDRRIFETLLYNSNGNRAIAIQDYKRIVAARAAEQISRRIELTIVDVLMNNSIVGTIPTSPTDDTPIPVEIRYYDNETGNQQRYLPEHAWGEAGATPYDDVVAMIIALSQHGGNPEIILLSPEAYAWLAADPKYQKFFETFHSEIATLKAESFDKARKVAVGNFGGYPVEVLVYSGAYRDDDGAKKQYLPEGFVCVLDRNIGHTLCGGVVHCDPVSVISEDITENSFIQRRGKIIGSQFIDLNNQVVMVRMESYPLPAPWCSWKWITMDAMNTNSISGGRVGPVVSIEFYSDDEDATLPDDMQNLPGGEFIDIQNPTTTSGLTFDGWYVDGTKQVPDSSGKYKLPNVDSAWEAVFA